MRNFVSKFIAMDYLSLIKKPIEHELAEFIRLFDESLSHTDGLLTTPCSISASVAVSACALS